MILIIVQNQKKHENELNHKIQEEVEKNRQKDRQLLHQSRLAQMGEMLSMIAHQWRQPLNAISATNNTLMIKTQLNTISHEEIIKFSTKISDYTQYLSQIITDFRDFFKPDKVVEQITYKYIIQETLKIIEPSLQNNNITIMKIINDETLFHTYPNELKQVILNILKNAQDVLVERKIQNPYIKIIATKYQLIIKDNGGGIDQEIMPHIFDPYFSTKKQKDGTGLGLYMSKVIIEQHCQGKLMVSNDDNGAIFTIEIQDLSTQ
jgi:C4-dicarboxylate-specific signal transduction histidine kinase